MLRRDDPHAPGYRVLQMWIADSGWTSNAPGQSYHIDDFELIPIVSAAEPLRIAWNVLDLSGLAGVNWAITERPSTQLPEKLATTAGQVDYAEAVTWTAGCTCGRRTRPGSGRRPRAGVC
jgi:hypothetical protein